MKKILSFLWIMATMFAVSCQKENEVKDEPLTFSSVKVGLGEEAPSSGESTKSVISVDTENFVDAYLFAFDASTKNILKYENNSPVAAYTTTKVFDWSLPINKAMDIWVVCNAGSGNDWESVLASSLTNSNLKESDLYGSNLMFTCTNSNELKALETTGAGLPMSGKMDGVTLTSPTATLTITVKKLFAKYSIRLDPSYFIAQGYTVSTTSITSSKSNTECPFFYNGGYAQTVPSKLAIVDRQGSNDCINMDNGEYVDLYYLENMQGDKSGASKWSTVYNDLGASAVALCSYVEIGVNCVKDATGEDFTGLYRIYLGKTDMKSNFDVQRNYHKRITLSISNPQEGFCFYTESFSVAPGSIKSGIGFESSLETSSNFAFRVLDGNTKNPVSGFTFSISSYDNNTRPIDSQHYIKSGQLSITVDSSVPDGSYILEGGRYDYKFSDELRFNVYTPPTKIRNNIVVQQIILRTDNTLQVAALLDYPTYIPITVRCMVNGQNCDFVLPPVSGSSLQSGIFCDFLKPNEQYSKLSSVGSNAATGVHPSYCYGSASDDYYNYYVSASTSPSLVFTRNTTPDSSRPWIHVDIYRLRGDNFVTSTNHNGNSPYFRIEVSSSKPEFNGLTNTNSDILNCIKCVVMSGSRTYYVYPYGSSYTYTNILQKSHTYARLMDVYRDSSFTSLTTAYNGSETMSLSSVIFSENASGLYPTYAFYNEH